VDPRDTLERPVTAERVVQRSRFLAVVEPVPDLGAAEAVLAAARKRHHEARHHCSAWVLGPDGATHRGNDDGEPAGTAGAPILAALTGAELTDVVAVVTRWFGGTLLGTGGLTRAYGGVVADALRDAPRVRRRTVAVLEVTAPLPVAGPLEHRLRTWADAAGAVVDTGRYDPEAVRFEVVALPLHVHGLRALLAGAGLGAAVHDLGHEIRPVRRR